MCLVSGHHRLSYGIHDLREALSRKLAQLRETEYMGKNPTYNEVDTLTRLQFSNCFFPRYGLKFSPTIDSLLYIDTVIGSKMQRHVTAYKGLQ